MKELTGQQLSPSITRIAEIARALGELSADVVFIGGAMAPLLQSDPVISRVRATKDVDAVMASTGYKDYNALQITLRHLGFRDDISSAQHIHRWRSPDGTPFDLVPAGDHFGGTRSEWGIMAVQTAVETEIEPGLKIRHASAPGFLALKWAAFRDRGADDPFLSHDLEDILALMVSRLTIVAEINDAPRNIQKNVRTGFRWLLASADYDDLIAGHLANAQSFQHVAEELRKRLNQIVAIHAKPD